MRIEQEGNIVWLLRNKQKGLKLKIIRELSDKEPALCNNCSFYKRKNSLCRKGFILCSRVRGLGLATGAFCFKIPKTR